jgi:hypothetical protein
VPHLQPHQPALQDQADLKGAGQQGSMRRVWAHGAPTWRAAEARERCADGRVCELADGRVVRG